MVLLLTLFLVYELSSTIEAKSHTLSGTYMNRTVVSKSGRHLTIGKQGITGEYSYSPYAKLSIRTVGFNSEITIKAVKMDKYLAMDSTGKVYLVVNETKEAVFSELRVITGFFSIRSESYPSKYLAISGTGSVSGGTNTKSDDTMFVLLFTT
ncbi:fibroblast growth factor 2 [Paramuricea clavata]|nr:fibroblast growth factor 2 [Paramuricea clavata]